MNAAEIEDAISTKEDAMNALKRLNPNLARKSILCPEGQKMRLKLLSINVAKLENEAEMATTRAATQLRRWNVFNHLRSSQV